MGGEGHTCCHSHRPHSTPHNSPVHRLLLLLAGIGLSVRLCQDMGHPGNEWVNVKHTKTLIFVVLKYIHMYMCVFTVYEYLYVT